MSKVKIIYSEIEDVVGVDYISDKDFVKAAYSRNVDPAFPDRWADMIVRPETTEEVSEIVKIANKHKIHMVPRGGGADLVGGSVTQGGILLDLTRMNRIIEINEDNYYCVVECGITWGALLSELQKKKLTTGIMGPGSGFSATIGGGLSNATVGFGSTKYGVVPDICLGVEVVLPNPQGTILRTGAAANKYAEPFCRYGVAPDFTGLFMGDVGTMGIKTKAFLKIFPLPPLIVRRDYMLLNKNYSKVSEIALHLQKEVRDGLHDLLVVPFDLVNLARMMAKEKPPKRARVKGPVFTIILEAFDERIMDVYLETVDKIMSKYETRPFEWQEVDLSLPLAEDTKLELKFAFNYFNEVISAQPPQISCTTCHKLPISSLNEAAKLNKEFTLEHSKEFPPRSLSLFATVIFVLPNGHVVIVGGMSADNINDENYRRVTMEMWHKKIRNQVRYGAAHYWLGEAISQSIVEADAYTPDFIQFFKNVKRTVDPNFLLSPNKFHMYNYEDDTSKYIVKEE